MTNSKAADSAPEDQPVETDAPVEDTQAETPAGEEAAEAASKEQSTDNNASSGSDDPIAALAAENAELKDRLMRALAEVENVRRRGERDRQDMAKFGAQSLAKELLPAVDNLRRALDSVAPEAKEESEVLKNLLTGIEMTEKQLLDGFEKNAIQKIDPLDEKFSYERHQAISEAPGTGKPAGTIVQVLQPGYMLHDRLLRPAMVVVAKGDVAPPAEDDHEGIDTTA